MRDAIAELTILTDRQLVEMARCGDQRAFGELAQRHWAKCVNLDVIFETGAMPKIRRRMQF